MPRKLLLLLVSIGFALASISCGGGGGGSNPPYTATVLPNNPAFPEARLQAGWNGVGCGFFYPNNQTNFPQGLAWNSTTNIVTSFHPGASGDYIRSFVNGTDGVQQVGQATVGGDPNEPIQGMIWTGNQASATPITATGYAYVVLSAVDNNYQVGQIQKFGEANGSPAVFHGASDNYVNLMPAGYFSGQAYCIDGNQVGGSVLLASGDLIRAALWTSHSAASFVDMHDDDFRTTTITGVFNNQQVGTGTTFGPDSVSHALMWTGSPASVVDMHPAGKWSSSMTGVRNNVQIGVYVDTNGAVQKACYWKGTADSMVDLDHFIKESHTGSVPFSIDAAGNIYGTVLYPNNKVGAVIWMKS